RVSVTMNQPPSVQLASKHVRHSELHIASGLGSFEPDSGALDADRDRQVTRKVHRNVLVPGRSALLELRRGPVPALTELWPTDRTPPPAEESGSIRRVRIDRLYRPGVAGDDQTFERGPYARERLAQVFGQVRRVLRWNGTPSAKGWPGGGRRQ